MTDRKTLGLVAFASAGFLFLAGCGGSTNYGPTFKVTPVTGKVTMAGEALPDAEVTLVIQGPMPNGFSGAGGKTDAQGHFEVLTGVQKGAPAGRYKVTVSKLVGPGGQLVVATEGMDLAQMVASGQAIQQIPPEFNDPDQVTTEVTVADGTPTAEIKIDIPKAASAPPPAQSP